MEKTYVIQHITRRRVDQAYPLVLLAHPSLTLQAWRQFCAGRATDDDAAGRPPTGILLAINSTDYIRGLCSYKVSPPAVTPVLSVDTLVFAHLFGPGEILEQMLDELRAISTSHGCQSIEVDADGLGEWLDRASPEQKLPVRLMRKVR